jgi:hypothetical protein
MNIRKFFGRGVEERIRPPARRNGQPVYSNTLEKFYYHLDDCLKKGRPFIYILDSVDSLSCEAELSKFQKKKAAARTGKTTAGSFGAEKAKINSSHLRLFINPLYETGSILLVINQTRDNLSGFGKPKSRSGGNALQFYACMEIWSSVYQEISKTYRKKSRVQGTLCRIRVRKNRVTGKAGKFRQVLIPIFDTYGIDDITSCIDYLVDEEHWKENKGIIKAPEFEFKGRRDKLADLISGNDMEKDLIAVVEDVWRDIENAVAIKRKPRYE